MNTKSYYLAKDLNNNGKNRNRDSLLRNNQFALKPDLPL